METSKSQFDIQLIRSETFIDNESETNDRPDERFRKSAAEVKPIATSRNNSDILSLIENTSINWQIDNFNIDITLGLKSLEFEAGLEEIDADYRFLRKRSSALFTSACVHATYFVGVANRIRRNLDDIKKGDELMQRNSLLLSEMKKAPGLQIGIIGGGKLGRQLAEALMEYAQVYPNELQISTRQPDALSSLKSRNVKCYFDNAKLASSVNILFLCVLPSQLALVVNDIKKSLPEKCIIYSLVRTEPVNHLKNLLGDILCSEFLIRPVYEINGNHDYANSTWNNCGDIIENLRSMNIINSVNPFFESPKAIVRTNEEFQAVFIYSVINICAFLNLNKKETFNALKKFLFFSTNKNIKLEDSMFFEVVSQSQLFPWVNLVDAAKKNTPLLQKIKQSKTFRSALSKTYLDYFEETTRFKTSFK